MDENKKHFCVIGSGASGLVSIKSCLEEDCLVTCYERYEDIGGLWRYTESSVEDKACVSKSTVINTCKEMTSFSDFPTPDDYPNFMRHDLVLEYFRMYAEHFKLIPHIQFNTQVLNVEPNVDYETTGKWKVTVKNTKTEEESSKVFDGVFVGIGHHVTPNVPEFKGLDKFKGKVLHSHDYKRGDLFTDQNVLVVGLGNSGGDAAVELCRYAKNTFVSTRRGTWVFPRSQPNGVPTDLGLSRFNFDLFSYMPQWMINWVLENLVMKIDHDLLGIKPKHPPMSQHGFVNDDFPNRILSGLIKIRPDIDRFDEDSVTFLDGTRESIDAVILATGYKFGFPFIDKSVLPVENNRVDLYKMIFPLKLEKPTLAIIGCIQPHGSVIAITEIQARWAIQVVQGKMKLPSPEEQVEEVRNRQQRMAQRYVSSQRHTIQVDGTQYMDEIAQELGCMPSVKDVLKSGDLRLAMALYFGGVAPYQYRLVGPHAWNGARDILLRMDERVKIPLRNSVTKQ